MSNIESDRRSRWSALACLIGLTLGTTALAGDGNGPSGQTQLMTTIEDFLQPGTQPEMLTDPFIEPIQCSFCHGGYDDGLPEGGVEPYDMWVTSMMAQSARDPIWHAALTIANQDANLSGEFCIRCHSPNAWLNGRSEGAVIDDFLLEDFNGVFCHFCHRNVDPVADVENPMEDDSILMALALEGDLPLDFGNARYVVDPIDTRRGPFDDIPFNFHAPAEILVSPFHREANLCGTCHDVSNPAFSKDDDTGAYVLNDLNTSHPTQDPYDMFPEQRTFSEWKFSQFADIGVEFPDGRFGGNLTGPLKTCQDCHMPDAFAGGCFAWEEPPFFPRVDMPVHSLLGGNTWVQSAVFDIYEFESGMNEETVAAVQTATRDFLRDASDMNVAIECDGSLLVTVTNYTGHKLPTGYPEGRRMWLNIQFFDVTGALVDEYGSYDDLTGHLEEADTKVYQAIHTFDESVAKASGLPAGTEFHLVLNNVVEKDNRIPPIGFSNADYLLAGAEPVGAVYADGQNWDDTAFDVPNGATEAVVTLYFQTSSKEYMEFLRDANVTNTDGQTAYDQWELWGRSMPVDMDMVLVDLTAGSLPDTNGDGVVDIDDLLAVLGEFGSCTGDCAGDVNCDGLVNIDDLLAVLGAWS